MPYLSQVKLEKDRNLFNPRDLKAIKPGRVYFIDFFDSLSVVCFR